MFSVYGSITVFEEWFLLAQFIDKPDVKSYNTAKIFI